MILANFRANSVGPRINAVFGSCRRQQDPRVHPAIRHDYFMLAFTAMMVLACPGHHHECGTTPRLTGLWAAVGAARLHLGEPFADWPDHVDREAHPEEVQLSNIRQLTFGGQNAEAYFDWEGERLVWQSTQPGFPDEQMFTMNIDGSDRRLVSTGLGRTTCGYFTRDGRYVYFSSTHSKNEGPQRRLDFSQGYVWMVNPQFSLYRRNLETRELELVLDLDAYVAETTMAWDGSYLTFTSDFEGDLQIYRANLDGGDIRALTNEFGYDGGPFVGWGGDKIVYRRSPLEFTDEERAEYLALLAENKVRPSQMEIWIMDADGENKRQVTHLGGANFAPFLHPNGEQIIFSSNHHDPEGMEFDLFVINVDGTGLRQITFTEDFDGFPMFNRDGTKLVWASNRFGSVPRETNVFIADWSDLVGD